MMIVGRCLTSRPNIKVDMTVEPNKSFISFFLLLLPLLRRIELTYDAMISGMYGTYI
jgi:hypothetical protein